MPGEPLTADRGPCACGHDLAGHEDGPCGSCGCDCREYAEHPWCTALRSKLDALVKAALPIKNVAGLGYTHCQICRNAWLSTADPKHAPGCEWDAAK